MADEKAPTTEYTEVRQGPLLTGTLRAVADNLPSELEDLGQEIATLATKLAAKSQLYGKLMAQHLLSKAQGL